MSIDLQAQRLKLKDVAKITGVNLSTVWRWCLQGVHGHKLRSFRIGGNRYVLPDDLNGFVAAQNEPDDADPGDVALSTPVARRPDEADTQAKATVG